MGYGGHRGPEPESLPLAGCCHAVNLVSGRTPGGAVWSGNATPLSACRSDRHVFAITAGFSRPCAREFLTLGRMLYPLELKVPRLRYEISPAGKKHGNPRPRRTDQ